jgi:hypothetical protein
VINFSVVGDPDFENNVSRESVGEIPSIGEAPSGSRLFDICKNKRGHRTGAKNKIVPLEGVSSLKRGPWQRSSVKIYTGQWTAAGGISKPCRWRTIV